MLGYGVDVGCDISGPCLVALHVAFVRRVDACHKHVEVAHGAVVGSLYFLDIFVVLAGMVFDYLGVDTLGGIEGRTVLVAEIAVDDAGLGTAIFVNHHEVVARLGRIFLLDDGLGKNGAVEEGAVAILLTVEV